MKKFLETLKAVSAYKKTENGAFALNSTGNNLLDAFGSLAAMRSRDIDSIINKFALAYSEDRLLAMKLLFYVRDARGGCGERDTFRVLLNWMAHNHPADIKANLKLVAEYGRWDDLYAFVKTGLENDALDIMKAQFEEDLANYKKGEKVSILAKWLKSENSSSYDTRELGRITRKYFGLTPKDYRKKLSMLRKATNVVEVKMSSKKWTDINYATVPSYASKNYANAFSRHDEEGYEQFLEDVKSGKTKVNAGTLFPYDLVKKYSHNHYTKDVDETVEEQWKALPNYVKDSKKFLVMADTSGSMERKNGLPMDTSVSLAIYFAERNTGLYHGKFITFTKEPRFFDLPDNLTLREKVALVMARENVGFDTNLEAAFDLVLKSAISAKASQEDLPDAILVISDMEINEFGSRSENTTFTKEMEARFADAGYKMPVLVYWNVYAANDTFHAVADENVRFVSGSSAAIFKGLCENMSVSAKELMLSVLNSERYKKVRIAE